LSLALLRHSKSGHSLIISTAHTQEMVGLSVSPFKINLILGFLTKDYILLVG
jgi:hypothetical protein